MRESNYRSAIANRASVSITTTLYDRRALDCTSDRPLINSLNHLAYLTSSSARVRETLCLDGGLERLVCILKECQAASADAGVGGARDQTLVVWKWSLALQCLLFLGTRGSESIRRRVVEAGVIPVITTVLDNYLELLGESSDDEQSPFDRSGRPVSALSFEQPPLNLSASVDPSDGAAAHETLTALTTVTVGANTNATSSGDATPRPRRDADQLLNEQQWRLVVDELPTDNNTSVVSGAAAEPPSQFLSQLGLSQGIMSSLRNLIPPAPVESTTSTSRGFYGKALIPRDEDVIWSLEILAFVSKYAYLKPNFQNSHLVPKLSVRDPTQPPLLRADLASSIGNDVMDVDSTPEPETLLCYDTYDFENISDLDAEYRGDVLNVFPLVERLTTRKFPREVPYWAGIIMRNSCRKDESRGGIRQCANFQCGKWEDYPRHFAKCRRCKRTKYCSKSCQLASWSFHRYWCAPTTASSSGCSEPSAAAAPAERQQSVSGTGLPRDATENIGLPNQLAEQLEHHAPNVVRGV